VSYYQTSAPNNGVDATLALGDLWFDSDDKFRVYRWNGSWVNVQDGTIPEITASLNVTTASLNTTIFQLGNLTASFNTLATQSYALSSSYVSSSASFNSSINNIQLTYATNTYALALSTQSMQASVTSSKGYTDGQISSLSGVYATPTSVLAIATQSMYASYNSSSAYTNAQISSLSSVYATPSYVAATATTTVNSAITQSLAAGGITSASINSSVSTVATAVSTLNGQVAAEYVVNTTTSGGGVRRVAGFRLSNTGGSGGSSDFIVQVDKFAIVNSSGAQNKVPFLVDGTGVYIDEAVIRSLDAGKITAGTVTVALTLTTAQLNAGKIASDAEIFNIADNTKTMQSTGYINTESNNGGSGWGSLNSSPQTVWLNKFYGWTNTSGGANSKNRFGKSTMQFVCTENGGSSVATGGWCDLKIVYRINGGGSNNVTPYSSRATDNNGTLNSVGGVELSGLSGGDEVEFGVYLSAYQASDHVNVVNLTSTCINF
jgi:hypothetical protein